MATQLVPTEVVQKSGKILFIAHLALGDFTYLQNCFMAFARAFPWLKVDLWVDEVRRTDDAAQWDHLKKYSLYDWVEACPCFDKVYRNTYSPELYRQSLQEARREAYPIVVSLATLRPHRYAALAREISPQGFIAGMKKRAGLTSLHHAFAYRRLDAGLDIYQVSKHKPLHISDVYAGWFNTLFGLDIPAADRFPFVDIPQQWATEAQGRLHAWGFDERKGRLVFINPYAKTRKRCWPLERVAELIKAMKASPAWQDACFIINATPQELVHATQAIERHALARTQLFTAADNFFQLPAMLAECDLIISVETAVMHLANAVHVPVVALMRQKNPEWVPLDRNNSTVITASRRRDWVREISVEQVMEVL